MPLRTLPRAMRRRGRQPPPPRPPRPIVRIAAAIVLATGASPAVAANVLFTQEMPIAHMTAEDRCIFETALTEMLDSARDGETRRWENPKTGAHGDLTPRSTFTDSDVRCRTIELENSAGGRSNRSVFTLCKSAEGWKVRSN